MPGPASAALDSSFLPVQSPSPEVSSDVEDYASEGLASSATKEAASAVKQAASQIQEAVQDIPLEQTPLGMGVAPVVPPAAP